MRLPFDYAVRNLGRSPLRLSLSVGAATLVALLAVAATGFVRGMANALGASGLPQNVMILGVGSEESVERSEISPQVGTLATADVDTIASVLGTPLVSSEVHVQLPLGAVDSHDPAAKPPATAIFRGVTPTAFLVHPQIRIVEGRAPEPSTDEVLVGRGAQAVLDKAGLPSAVGSTLLVDGRELPIVGIHSAPGTVMDGEIWMPLHSLKVATQRTTDSCVVVQLAPGGEAADVDVFTTSRIELEVTSIGESEYYAALGRFLAPVRWLVVATAAIVSLGGLLGGLSTMDAAFAARVRELGTLQALGFRRRSIAWSFLQESLLASIAGALLAGLLAILFLDHIAVRSAMGTFEIRVDAVALAAGLAAGLLLGVIGALVPAFRCLRLPVPDALKSSG